MCTRVVYHGLKDIVMTARSMDWMSDLGTNLWILPRGLQRTGAVKPGGISWTSKYGSVVATAFEAATADGMNEKGLVVNLLYLAESDYGDPLVQSEEKAALCVSDWAQYVLDNYAAVAEAVRSLKKEPFFVVALETPDGHAGTVHLAISNSTGDSAIIEYVNGKQIIHHGPEFQVMTNSPIYDEQLVLNTYWKGIGGTDHAAGHQPCFRPLRARLFLH